MSANPAETEYRRRLLALGPAERRSLLAELRAQGGEAQEEPPCPQSSVPASPAQVSQWYLWRLMTDSDAYHVVAAFDISGPLAVDALRAALQTLVDRHDALRSRFHQREGQVWRAAGTVPQVTLEVRTVGAGTGTEPGTEAFTTALATAAATASEPFDLTAGPLHRFCLWDCGQAGERHLLLLAFHHIIIDEWSVRLLLDELGALYAAELGAGPRPPELPHPARPARPAEVPAESLAYWSARLAGARPRSPVADRPAGGPGPRAGGRAECRLPDAFAAVTARLGREQGASPFTVLLALCWLFLARHTGQRDVCLGVPVSSREGGGDAEVVDFFIHTLVIRGEVRADRSFRELVEQAKAAIGDAFRHRGCPLDLVLRELRPDRYRDQDSFVRTTFAYSDAGRNRGPGLELTGAAVTPVHLHNRDTPFDLQITAFDSADGFKIVLEYAADRYLPASAALWTSSLVRLAGETARDPDRATGHLLAGTPGEQPGASRAAEAEQQIPALARALAAGRPDAPALLVAGEPLTRAQLWQQVRDSAACLTAGSQARGRGVSLAANPILTREPQRAAVAVLARWFAGALAEFGDPGDGDDASQTGEPGFTGSLLRLVPGGAAPVPPAALAFCPSLPEHADEPWLTYDALAGQYASLLRLLAPLTAASREPLRVGIAAPVGSGLSAAGLLATLAGHCLVSPEPQMRLGPETVSRWAAEREVDVLLCRTELAEGLAADRVRRAAAAPPLLLHQGRALAPWLRESMEGNGMATHVVQLPGWYASPARARILGPWLDLQPVGVPGELAFCGDATGPLPASAGKVASNCIPDRWSETGGRLRRTGMRARIRADGVVHIDGACGETSQSELIGAAARAVPGVFQAVAVTAAPQAASPSAQAPEITVYVVCASDSPELVRSLRAAVARLSPAAPPAFVRLPRLPIDRAGRVDGSRLAQIHAAGLPSARTCGAHERDAKDGDLCQTNWLALARRRQPRYLAPCGVRCWGSTMRSRLMTTSSRSAGTPCSRWS